MKRRSFITTFCFFLATVTVAAPQGETPKAVQRDAQALAVLQRVSLASGRPEGTNVGFEASGTITYFVGKQDISGPIVLKGLNTKQFRYEIRLPDGVRSFVLNQGNAISREPNGQVIPVDYYNAVAFPILPHLVAASANADSRIAVTYVGESNLNGRLVHNIRIQEPSDAPRLRLCPKCPSDLFSKDIVVEEQTGQITRVSDNVYPNHNSHQGINRTFDLANYEAMGGATVPTLITETVAGTKIFQIQITSVSFGVSLSDAEFATK